MRKTGSIILLFLYLLSVEGLLLHRHFCAGEIAEVSYFSHPDEQDCCGTDECNDCYDDHVTVRVQTEHVYKTPSTSNYVVSIPADLLTNEVELLSFYKVTLVNKKARVIQKDFPPPDPLYLINCTWLI